MAKNGEKTRFHLTLLLMGVALIEALIKAAWSSFPITELYSIQGVAFGGYMTARTVSNIDQAKYGGKNDQGSDSDCGP